MKFKELLEAKKAELVALKDAINNGDEAAITKANELGVEIAELENKVKAAEKAQEFLKGIGTPAAEEDKKSTGKKSGVDYIVEKVKSNKGNHGWSVNARVKASTDPITSIQIDHVDRDVEGSTTKVNRFSDLLPKIRVENEATAVKYIKQGAVEGAADTVAEGGKKPQMSTSFSVETESLIKVAVYAKETDEAVKQGSILQGTINETVTRTLLKKENTEVITTIIGDASASDVEYDVDASDQNATTQAYMEAILEAKAQVEDDTDYTADLVLMHPTDYFNMAIAKDANGQYFGGGWASGAYGNGSYNGAVTPWGLSIFVTKDIDAGDAYVISTDACRYYHQDDVDVRVFDQNEDDPIYNLITIRAEEFMLPVVRNSAAVVKVTPSE